jgi:hypothetical protein
MYQTIGEQQSMFSWKREGDFYRLTPEQAEIALQITGVNKAREGNDLHNCLKLN